MYKPVKRLIIAAGLVSQLAGAAYAEDSSVNMDRLQKSFATPTQQYPTYSDTESLLVLKKLMEAQEGDHTRNYVNTLVSFFVLRARGTTQGEVNAADHCHAVRHLTDFIETKVITDADLKEKGSTREQVRKEIPGFDALYVEQGICDSFSKTK